MDRKFKVALGVCAVAVGMVAAFELGRHGSASRPSGETEVSDFAKPSDWPSDWGTGSPEGAGGFSSPSSLEPLETLEIDPTHPVVEFLSSETSEGKHSMVLVGAPGIWPPAALTTDRQGVLYLPDTDIRTLTGDSFRQYELMARTTEGGLAFWGVVDLGRYEHGEDAVRRTLELEPSAPVRVAVVGPEGERVEGADLSLAREAVGFIALNKRTGPGGEATFRSIPPGEYTASASYAEVGSGRLRFAHEAEGETDIEIVLDDSVVREQPKASGSTESKGERSELEVRLRGLEAGEWSETTFEWRAKGRDSWRRSLLEEGEGGARIWRERVGTTPVELRVRNAEGASDRRTIRPSEGSAFEWEVDLSSSIDLYVVDSYGSPVEGALIDVWKGNRRVASTRSRGSEPVPIRLELDGAYRLVAIDSHRGEAVRRVDGASGGREVTLTLDRPLFSSSYPGRERVGARARIESILGVPLVRDGGAWLVDASEQDSRAARSGLRRGDRLMSVHRREGERWRVLVDRGGELVETRLVGEP